MITSAIQAPKLYHYISDLHTLSVAQEAFQRYLEAHSASPNIAWKCQTAFTEIVTNGLKHHRAEQLQTAWAHLKLPRGFMFFVKERGSGPESAALEFPALPKDLLASSGRGLYLVSQLIDQWIHERANGSYTQYLIKYE